jgi:hypothetical protein
MKAEGTVGAPTCFYQETYRVYNMSVYTFINDCSFIMSDVIKLKPIPVHFSALSPYICKFEPSAVFKIGSCDGLPLQTLLLAEPTTKNKKK